MNKQNSSINQIRINFFFFKKSTFWYTDGGVSLAVSSISGFWPEN